MKFKVFFRCSALIVLLSIISSGIGCSKIKPMEKTNFILRDCAYFQTSPITLTYEHSGDAYSICKDICSKSDETAMLINYMNVKDGTVQDTAVIFLGIEGEQISSLSLTKNFRDFLAVAISYTSDGRLAVMGIDATQGYMIRLLSSTDGVTDEYIRFGSGKSPFVDFAEYEGKWVLLSHQAFIVFDGNGEKSLEVSIPSNTVMELTDLFDFEGHPSVWMIQSEEVGILSLNHQTGSLIENSLSTFQWMDDLIYREKSHEYIVDNQGVYRLDDKTGKAIEIANWNTIDIAPSQFVFNITKNYVLDDNTIIRCVSAIEPGKNDELIFMKHRDTDPNEGKKVLTIGGYGVSNSDLVRYAAYLYNTGDYDFRIELVEYSSKYYYEDTAGMSRARADIISDMNTGNGDDLFFGADFDFNLWGIAGMVVDMKDYAENDPAFDISSLIPSIVELAEKDGHLYQIFPSFTIKGFVGYSDLLKYAYPLTIEQALAVCGNMSEEQILLNNAQKMNIATLAIQYRLDDFLSDENGFSITDDHLKTIIAFADACGTEENASQNSYSDPNLAYIKETLLLKNALITSPYEFNALEQMGGSSMFFFGIPSVFDSARLCLPRTLISISSGSEHKDACWEFVKLLFSEEAQIRAMQEDSIPVNVTVFEDQIRKAMNPELMDEADKVAAMFSSYSRPMSADTADRYRACVNSLNSFNCNDIDITIILWEELSSYYIDGKPLDDVRKSMENRINLYLNELKK